MTEINYAFRERMLKTHVPGLRNENLCSKVMGARVTDEWEIVYPECDQEVLEYAARDLAEFLSVSMEVFVRARRVKSIEGELALRSRKILLYTGEADAEEQLAYRIFSDADGIAVVGKSPRAVAQGVYFIEDRMRAHMGPVIEQMDVVRKRFSPRE